MRTLRVVLFLVVLLGVVLVGWTGWQTTQAVRDLRATAFAVDRVLASVQSEQDAEAERWLGEVQRRSHAASEHLEGRAWKLTEELPGVGDDITALRQSARLVDRFSHDLGPDLLRATQQLDPARLRPEDGRIDLQPLVRAAPSLTRVAGQLEDYRARADAIDVTEVAAPVAAPVTGITFTLQRVDALVRRAASAARMVPALLGEDGPRRYLVVLQDNARVRATGGALTAYVEVVADGGELTLGEQGDVADLESASMPVTRAETRLLGGRWGRSPHEVTADPDFPRAAELLAGAWDTAHDPGDGLDGVVAVDPVALSFVLEGVGPIVVDGTELTADDVARTLLNGVYLDGPAAAASPDAFLGAATRAGLEAVARGRGDAAAVLDGLTRAVLDGRVLIWSDHPADQGRLLRTVAAGSLPVTRDARPEVGVYLNGQTGAELGFYLDREVAVTPMTCDGGRQWIGVRVDLTSRVPDPESLPDVVTGTRRGDTRGNLLTTVLLYAPRGGGFVGEPTLDGAPADSVLRTHQGHPVLSVDVTLRPGETTVLDAALLTGPRMTGTPRLRITPSVRPDTTSSVAGSDCEPRSGATVASR